MAGKIKGITIEIGGNTQPLNKSLEDVNKKSKSLQSELKQVSKLLKMDPGNADLIAQKQKLLAEAVENSKEKLDRLKVAQAQVNEQFTKGEISEEQYRAFQREVVKAEQELGGFEKQLKDTAAASKSFGDKMQAAGEKMQSVGANMTKYVTVPLAAAGAGMVAVGKTFDDAFDNIRIGTGATGKALEGLNDDFRKVAKQVPSSFGDISTAIADYNTRLGISGQALQDLSVQTLNLARITEGDLGKIIEETSQAFQAFQVPTENYGDALDYVFKVAQSTGISIDRLEQNLVKFSPALKQMGFDFYDSAALMGFFDKAGVEVEQAMTGLNKALVNMAKAGVTDANEALQMLFEEIKDAPSDIKATELAIEIFGSKAGPLMASAIREGKLEYEALVQELMNSKETINGVADETDDWAEGLAKLKNQVMVAAEPIATTLFDALNKLVPLIEKAVPPLQKMADSFANMPQGVQVAIVAFAALLALMGPLLQGIGAIVIAAPGLAAAFTVMTGPIGLVVAAIGLLIAAIVLLYKQWKENGEKSKKLIAEFAAAIQRTIDNLKNWLSNTWDNIRQTASNVWNNIKSAILNPIESAKQTIMGIITTIKNAFANMQITIPKPKLPHVSVNWKSVGVGDAKIKIPDFNLNWYKTGGIFARPSIIGVGEAGTEAVIPLDKLPGLMADALRDVIGVTNASISNERPIELTVNLDGKVIAQNLYQRQRDNARGRGLR